MFIILTVCVSALHSKMEGWWWCVVVVVDVIVVLVWVSSENKSGYLCSPPLDEH